MLTGAHIAQIYGIPEDDLLGIYHYDAGRGIKVTIVKPGRVASGDPDGADVFRA